MVHTCVVYGCTNRADNSAKRGFYGFPTVRLHEDKWSEELSRERRTKWIAAIGRKGFTPSVHSKVCSDHFVEELLKWSASHRFMITPGQYLCQQGKDPEGHQREKPLFKHPKSFMWLESGIV
ncbi:THAP domain-containing protein 1-like [Pecten maximus]|uniref:THAP domain-containing protein 1-like n=1 Tax=Pecten maximus TaxID=6579 RepID=UPI001458375A|nr:THAP domain-containing protein 1-like [Pecten maximus]